MSRLEELRDAVFFNDRAERRIRRAVLATERATRDHRLPRRRSKGRRYVPTELVRFVGCCKVDELNPDTKYPGIATAFNEYVVGGGPTPGEREWLLVKCGRPFESSTDDDPGQEPHFPMHLYNVTMAGASTLWWEYYLILDDFNVTEGDTKFDLSAATATASSQYGGYVPANAKDGNVATWWWSSSGANGQWWRVHLASAVAVNRVRWYYADIVDLTIVIEGSHDGSSWDTLETTTRGAVDTWFVEDFDNEVAYEYYQLRCTWAGSGSWWKLKEAELWHRGDCASWNTMPDPVTQMIWGTDGMIDFNLGVDVLMATIDRHISCCYPGFGYERTVYGICLRPYLCGDGADSDWRIDYRKWLVRL